MDTIFFSWLEGGAFQRVLQTSVHAVFWSEDSGILLDPLVEFLGILSNNTATTFEKSALVTYLLYAVFLSFKVEYATCFIKTCTV